ncbi:unnamed protein product, partial [Mesorhabditis belari]|uniref:Uncharacterized protein n=1 Tax=Mesorhabditis belari TaxID=2138241 RepID=A0AAF3FP33_9BILA
MVSLYKVVSLVYNAFGGTEKFSYWPQDRDRRIRLNVPPLCCCSRCLLGVQREPPSPKMGCSAVTGRSYHRPAGLVDHDLGGDCTRCKIESTGQPIGCDFDNVWCLRDTHSHPNVAKEFLDEHWVNGFGEELPTSLRDFHGNLCFNVTASILFFILALVQFIFVRPGRCPISMSLTEDGCATRHPSLPIRFFMYISGIQQQ